MTIEQVYALLTLAGSSWRPERVEQFKFALFNGDALNKKGIGTKNYPLLCLVMGLPEPYRVRRKWLTPQIILHLDGGEIPDNMGT